MEKFTFKINGKEVSYADGLNLLEILRKHEGILSAKDGCSEGACGTCMVLVDGRAVRACIMKPSRLAGKEVITIEGMTEREKDVYAYCFAETGAVQCGFCIPGMVISGKGLLDVNNNPTREEVLVALRGNICRCTGYQKIADAILLAGKMLRENLEIPEDPATGKVGQNLHRLDARKKTLGEGGYVDDLSFEGMTYGSAIRPPKPRMLVKAIHTEKAKAHPDCVGVFTAADIEGNRHTGHLPHIQDWPCLIEVGEATRYVGDSVCLVVSEKEETLQEIKDLVEIEYEELEPILTPQDALKEGADVLHPKGNLLFEEHMIRGDAEKAIAESAYVFTETFKTPPTEHGFLEPECAVGMPNEEGDGVIIYTAGQSIYDEQRETASILGLPPEKVHVKGCYVGGGFGGKEDMSVQHHAGFLAQKTGRIVKVKLSREESLKVHPKRHAADMEFTVACDEEGYLTGLKARIITDSGAYASLGGPVLQRACTHAGGPYNYQNVDILGRTAYTNNPPGGAFRGFGVTQSCFAIESCISKLAEMVGISTWEIRYKNAVRPGEVLPNGQIADPSTAIVETLEAVKEEYESNQRVGIACAMKNAGLGVGLPDAGRCRIFVNNGKAEIHSSAACIGQGMATILLQMFCEETGFTKDQVWVSMPDTKTTPNSGTTTASRQTVITGEATRLAAKKMMAALKRAGGDFSKLEGKEFVAEYFPATDPMSSDKLNPVSHVAYGYATQLAILDEEGKVEKVVAAHDVGHAINPHGIQGQIDGGVLMCMGYALTEDFPLDQGVPTAKFGTLGLLRANQAPEIKTILVEKNDADLAFGAKGVGEITAIPLAPAIQNAYYQLDGKFRTSLPLEDTFYRKAKK